MDPKLASILTVFVVGFISFLIGWFLTSSSEKGKLKKYKEENSKLLKEKEKAAESLEMRKKKLDKVKNDLDLVTRERNEVKQKNAKLIDDNKRLEAVSHSPSGKLYKQEYEALYEQYVDEMEKRRNLEREKLNWMSGGNTSDEKKNSISEQPSQSFIEKIKDEVLVADDKLKLKLNSIFNRVGYGNALQKDKLTSIIGIDTEVESRLNKIGIFNFKQISMLFPSDLEVIEDAIGDISGRATKEDWIGQAKKLLI